MRIKSLLALGIKKLHGMNTKEPKTYPASDHDIDISHIDKDALWVVHRLTEAGHSAYLVGGSVRDLLQKKTPKDFDISTSAKPEEVKSLFGRQCLLIGRRFRLAHIRFGHKVIEVATFRSGDTAGEGLITQDNVWGTEYEDVMRRDFTINGLCYDAEKHAVIDYVDGWQDIHKQVLRTIGDPEVRFRQDPVRMIRLLKFRARFRYEIVTEVKMALLKCRGEIVKSSPARVLEEIFRMLESGYSAPFFQMMVESRLLELLFPRLTYHFNRGTLNLYPILIAADEINQSKPKNPIDRGILIAALLFPIAEDYIKREWLDNGVVPHLGQLHTAVYETVRDVLISSFPHFPRRIAAIATSAITNQFRLVPFSNKKVHPGRTLRSRDFPEALLLLKIRAEADESLIPAFEDWKDQYRRLNHSGGSERRRPHGR